jgi:hypothetical protein
VVHRRESLYRLQLYDEVVTDQKVEEVFADELAAIANDTSGFSHERNAAKAELQGEGVTIDRFDVAGTDRAMNLQASVDDDTCILVHRSARDVHGHPSPKRLSGCVINRPSRLGAFVAFVANPGG